MQPADMAVEVPRYRELLGFPGFRRLTIGGLAARLAEATWQVAIVLFVLQRFHSATLAGATVFVAIFPGLLASPIAGALLDRYGRSRLITLDYALVAASLGALVGLAQAGVLTPAQLLGISVVSSLTMMLSRGGQRSLLPLIVPETHWDRSNAVDSLAYTLTAIVGPALGGLLVGTLGGQWALAFIGALYAFAALIFLGLRDPAVQAAAGSIWQSAVAAIAYVFRNPTLRGIAIGITVSNIGGGIIVVGLPVLVLGKLHGTDFQVGVIWALQGVSGAVAGLVAGRLGTRDRERRVMIGAALLVAVAWLTLLLAPSLPWVAAASLLSGLAIGPWDVAMFSLRQRRTERAWFGRAFAISMSLNFAGFPIGSVLAGPLLHASVSLAMGVAIGTFVLAGLLLIALVPRPGHER